MLPTESQIQFAVDFWLQRLKAAKNSDLLTAETLSRFDKALRKVIREGLPKTIGEEPLPDMWTRSVSCHNSPARNLKAALQMVTINESQATSPISLDLEPPLLTDYVDLIFNPDGSIDLFTREDNIDGTVKDAKWEHINLAGK